MPPTRPARLRRALANLDAIVAGGLAATGAAPAGPTETTETVEIGARSYEIALPAHPGGAPILMALHGGGGSPRQFALNSGLAAPATAAGYAVIYPAGSGRGPASDLERRLLLRLCAARGGRRPGLSRHGGRRCRGALWARRPVLRLLTVVRGDHGWPGWVPSRRTLGRWPASLDANRAILRFLDEIG